jgi:hypothetical protein
VAGLAAAVALTAYHGSTTPPDVSHPDAQEAAQDIAATLHAPAESDNLLIGDYLIERFYILDVDSGERKVGDICKGRIIDVIVTVSGDGAGYIYRLVLDRRGMTATRGQLAAFIAAVAPYDVGGEAISMGLRLQGGSTEVFNVNYDGRLPGEYAMFRGPDGEDIFSFMRMQDYDEIGGRLQLMTVEGNNYLLRTSAGVPYYQEEFRTKRAILVAQLLIVDATSPAQVSTYHEISATN